jgi:pheromone shutdown protein TraB
MILLSTVGMIPVIKTILTERDEILTDGIKAACQRAGKDGRVVAVLGLLHVNGVARRMLVTTGDEDRLVDGTLIDEKMNTLIDGTSKEERIRR